MNLLRDWQRRVAGGTAAALLVPVAIVAGALALGTGGFGGLSALGQAFSGPDIPGVEPDSARAAAGNDADDAGDLLAGVGRMTAAAPVAARRGAGGARRAPARRRDRTPRRDRPSVRPTPSGAQPQPQPQPPPTAPPQPTPAPAEPPSTIRQVGEQVKDVTDRIPVAGEPAGQVVDTIVETAEQLPLP